MKDFSIALMIYGEPGSSKSVFTEEKYKKLAAHFIDNGFDLDSVLYHDSIAEKLGEELLKYKSILVWVNPVEKGNDRTILDALLKKISQQGVFVSSHPDTILKMGTKEILYDVRDTEFGGDVKLYHSFNDFKARFFNDHSGIRILKQYRGNGGNGVFKIDRSEKNLFKVTHATSGDKEELMTHESFITVFEKYFENNGILIDQAWNPNIINGMVRCYLTGSKVAGFGYQEINALYPIINGVYKKPSQRFYYSEDCGLFWDLKEIMENKWIMQLQKITDIDDEMLPVIWDADFFINKVNTENASEKYSLCEINVSSVSPFPESAIPYIVNAVAEKLDSSLNS